MDAKRIKIAEFGGWRGLPVEQCWQYKEGVKFWRSMPPSFCPPVFFDHFTSSMVKRVLVTPEDTLFVKKDIVNGDKLVLEYFEGGWSMQTNPWPKVDQDLSFAVNYLPDYFNDLDAIQMVIEDNLLSKDWTLFIDKLALITGAYSQKPPLRWMMLINASAKDKAEALYETIIYIENEKS